MALRPIFLTAIALISACELHAATITVTNTNDNLAGSLRQAIVDARAGDMIVFNIPKSGPGYDAATGTWTIGLTSGELLISRDLTIDGGKGRIRVQRVGPANANPQSRVFRVASGMVNISRLTIANGFVQFPEAGAGVFNSGNLTLLSCTIIGNYGVFEAGGVLNGGTLTMVNCTVTGNRTAGSGAGVLNRGTLFVRSCTIARNAGDSGTLGNGIHSSGSSPVRVRNTVIALNTGGQPTTQDVFGAFTSDGYNFIGIRDGASGFPGPRDQTGTASSPANPQLGTLADNGGPVQTMAPLVGSPLRDRGGSGTADDARALPRPIDNPSIANAPEGDGSDVGAVEIDVAQTGPTFVVNTADEHIDDMCSVGDCSLWDALNASNANAANNSVITFAPNVRGTIPVTLLPDSGMNIVRAVTITGPGASALTLSGAGVSRILTITSSGLVTISGLTLADAQADGSGGAIRGSGLFLMKDAVFTNNKAAFGGGAVFISAGSASLERCTFNGNVATDGFSSGGAIGKSGGLLNIDSCTFSGNSAGSAGGALYNAGGSSAIVRSMFAANTAATSGGAIRNDANSGHATARIENSTFSGNESRAAAAGGGAISNAGANGNQANIALVNCTFSGNAADSGGAVHNANNNTATVVTSFTNTIFRTGARGANFANTGGTLQSLGSNISNDAAGGDGGAEPGGFLNAGGDRRNTDLRLDPAGLRDNGGPTQTIALLGDSPAINAANPQNAPERDQRLVDRTGAPDVGAFEFNGVDPNPPPPPPTRFANISTRLRVEPGYNVLIGGLIITGAQPKRVIVRAVGPSLAVGGALGDPQLELYNGAGELIAWNDNWQDAPNRQEIIDTTIAPANGVESAILTSLPQGAYTAIVSGVNGGTGVGLVEVYDLDNAVASKLANIATRGFVQTGDDVMIGGMIVVGSQSQNVLLRAIGPSLPVNDKLGDPVLELFDGNGVLIAANNNWRDTQQAQIEATSIPPADDLESAIVAELTPAAYTAVLRGVNGAVGVALVEAYALD